MNRSIATTLLIATAAATAIGLSPLLPEQTPQQVNLLPDHDERDTLTITKVEICAATLRTANHKIGEQIKNYHGGILRIHSSELAISCSADFSYPDRNQPPPSGYGSCRIESRDGSKLALLGQETLYQFRSNTNQTVFMRANRDGQITQVTFSSGTHDAGERGINLDLNFYTNLTPTERETMRQWALWGRGLTCLHPFPQNT